MENYPVDRQQNFLDKDKIEKTLSDSIIHQRTSHSTGKVPTEFSFVSPKLDVISSEEVVYHGHSSDDLRIAHIGDNCFDLRISLLLYGVCRTQRQGIVNIVSLQLEN